ncbi:MAG TPA: hypothetical protein VG406_28420 [Isosphaeraceae bacterium]|nr:hypothetical protein [Isosphaeraceae bacterium]
MAKNATVEKLQALALRHGEKAAVTLAAVLFFLFVIKAITRPAPIEFGPDALQKKAEQADTNLSRKQEPSQILETLVAQGLKPETDFEKVVANQQAHALNPAEFVVKNKWVTPEPGAGLIRDQPELIAPDNLYAYPNRGGYLLFATNEKGDRIEDTGKDAAKKKKSGITPPRQRRGSMGFGGMAGGSMGGMSRPGGGASSAKAKEDAEKRRLEDEARLRKALAGDVKEAGTALKKDESKAATAEATTAYKEIVKGLRSVVITGTLDNKKLRVNYLNALKDPNLAYPNYKRLDVQRSTLGEDGQWSKFADVDADANLNVLDNLPEVDDELVPDDVRLEALVDPLPLAKAGYWTGVHVASLVPKEKVEIKKPAVAAGGMGGGSGSYMAQMQQMQQQQQQNMGGGGGSSSSMQQQMMMRQQMNMGGSSAMGMGKMGMPGAAGATGPAEDTTFPKSEADEVMIRSIDFTVQPDTTYRYQVRIVVWNPNLHHTNVNPGVDTESEELKSDWSDPTDPVTVPADVAAYAMKKAAATGRRDDQVTFQVVRFDPHSGYTLTRNDEAGPGELIGQYMSAQVPSSEGKGGPKQESIDFNSHRVVLDTMGGFMPAPKSIGATAPFEEPAVSMILRQDGSVAMRSQPQDITDAVREQMEKDYQRALKDSGKKRTRRRGRSGMPGMMGGSSSSSMSR